MQILTVMFVTAVCFLFLLKLKWPKNKNIYDIIIFPLFNAFPFLLILHITWPFYVISGEYNYKDLVTSIYPFNKPEEGWFWPAEIL